MAEQFLGEIRMMSFAFPPKGWALADGQLLPINQNQALFSLLGTTFGGNGQTNFALPDLRAPDADPRRQRTHPRRAGRGGGAHAQERRAAAAHPLRGRETAATGGSATPNGNFLGGGNNVYLGRPAAR